MPPARDDATHRHQAGASWHIGDDWDRARQLQQMIDSEHYIARLPTIGEREAVERGLDAMGIPRAPIGQVTPPPARQP
jgi:hypothetical protein